MSYSLLYKLYQFMRNFARGGIALIYRHLPQKPPKVDPSKARHPVRMIAVDDFSADWLRIKAEADHKTPAEIIGEMVRERIAVTV